MSKSFKISVITPSFNSGNFLERAIKSVLKQDYQNWEHIVMDGGSTDNTLAILKKYPHLKWVSQKDGGQSDAMNKGFLKSTGDIIVYLNADDYFLPKAFSSIIKEFENGAKFVVGNISINSPRLNSKFINTGRTTLKGMLRHWEPNSFCHNPVGYFYLKEVQTNCPFNLKNSLSMDLEFLLDAAEKYKFTKIEKTLGCFEDSTTTKTSTSQSKLDYWQTKNFPYLIKHLHHFNLEQRIEYLHDQRESYSQLQLAVNSKISPNSIFLNPKKIPLISVIIPTYNDKKHIIRSINSVLDQGLSNLEVIIIDDASTDKTYSFLKSKYKNNKLVKIYRHKLNKKLGAARNTGMSKAKGKYIFFVDSDDWIEPNTLIHLASISETYQADIVACGINKTWDEGKTEKYHQYSFACSGGNEALEYFSEYKIGSVVWNKLYLREFLTKNDIKFISPYWHEDVNFTTLAIFHCKNYISISNPYYNYFQRPNSIVSGKQTILHLRSYLKLLVDMETFISKNGLRNNKLTENLANRLIRAHALNDFNQNISKYISSRSRFEWENDFKIACQLEIPEYNHLIFDLITNIANPIQNIVQSKTQSFGVTNQITPTEEKIIQQIRKIKYGLIPENSFRKKLFDLIKRH